MICSRQNGGGFVADEMGLGKTLSFLSLFVVERQLGVLWRAVLESREAKDRKHLLVSEQQDGDACPSQVCSNIVLAYTHGCE